MLELPKKRPWLLIVLFYLVIIGGWVAFYMLAKNHSGNKRSAEETEALMRQSRDAESAKPPGNSSEK